MPVEVLVIGFPGSQFNGEIIPALTDLVERNVITVVDGLLVQRADDGTVTVVEFEEAGASPQVDALAALVHKARDLVSEDVNELVASLEPGSSAAVLVFEHTWAVPLRDAMVGSGGVLLGDIHIPVWWSTRSSPPSRPSDLRHLHPATPTAIRTPNRNPHPERSERRSTR